MMTRWKTMTAAAAVVVAATGLPGAASAQTVGGAWYGAGSGASLMQSLGMTDVCEFYYFVTIGTRGSFPLSVLYGFFPQCLGWTPQPEITDDGGGTGDVSQPGDGSGDTDSGVGGTGGSGNAGDQGGTGGSGGTGGTGGPGGTGGGVPDEDWDDAGLPAEDWTGGSATTTPEPVSLLLFGTGLAGISGVQAMRRRRRRTESDS